MVGASALSAFLLPIVLQPLGRFSLNLAHVIFPPFFGNLEFLRKTQKYIYFGNSVRCNDFDKIFGPQDVHRVFWYFWANIVSGHFCWTT